MSAKLRQLFHDVVLIGKLTRVKEVTGSGYFEGSLGGNKLIAIDDSDPAEEWLELYVVDEEM